MSARIHLGISILLIGAWLGTGCTPSTQGKTTTVAPPEVGVVPVPVVVTNDPAYTREEVDRRTEGHARYAAGVLHDLNDEPEEAAEDFYQAALQDPGNEDLVLEVSRRLLQLKQNDRALEVLTKATGSPDASGELYARLGLVYSILKDKEKAIAANRQAIRKLPNLLAGYQHLAQIYLQTAQFEEGLKVLAQAAKQEDVDAEFLVDLAELYASFLRAGASGTVKADALKVLDRAAKLAPNNPVLLQRLGDDYSLMGESDKALVLYLKLLERFPGLPGLREKLTDVYLRKQDRKGAAEQLEAIVRANPTNPQAYYFLGSIAFEEKNSKQAVEYFEKTILLSPSFEPAYYDLAGAYINLNRGREALAVLERARGVFSQNFVGEFFSAMAYNRLKDHTNALQHLVTAEVIARATDTNRLTHLFYYQLGSTYERNQKYEEAEKYFRKCLELAPDFAEVMNYMGYMWVERGERLPEARTLIEKAVQLEPKNAAFLDSLGWVLFKLGKPKEGLGYLLKAVEYSEEPDATLFDHLGDIHAELRQTPEAQAAWRKSLGIEANPLIEKKLGASAAAGGSGK